MLESIKGYNAVLTILIATLTLKAYSLMFADTPYALVITYGVLGIMFFIYVLRLINAREILVSDIIFILLILLILIFFRKKQLLALCVICLAFLPLSPNETIKIYRNSSALALLIAFVYGLLTGKLYSLDRGTFTMGMGNENSAGFLLALIATIILLDSQGANKKKSVSLYILVMIVENFVFGDRTALIMLVLFPLILKIMYKFSMTKFLKLGVIIFPGIMAYTTYWMTINFPRYGFLVTLNHLLSDRINIWNYYFTRTPISLISNNNIFVVSAWGADYTPHQGAFDGSYAYILYVLGLIFLGIFVCGLSLCNYKLLKNNQLTLLALIVTLELVGFSENGLFSYALSFGSIFALMGYHKNWLTRRDIE